MRQNRSMARRVPTDPEILAQVEAALIAGQTLASVSRLYGLPKTTVQSIRNRMTSRVSELTDSNRPNEDRTILPTRSLDDLLTSVLEDNLKALQMIARTAQNERYINGQTAAAIAALYEKIATFSVQLLSAAAEPPDSN